MEETLRKLLVFLAVPVVAVYRRLRRYLAAFVDVPLRRSDYLATIMVDDFHEVPVRITLEDLQHPLSTDPSANWSGMCREYSIHVLVIMSESERDDLEDAGDISLGAGLHFE